MRIYVFLLAAALVAGVSSPAQQPQSQEVAEASSEESKPDIQPDDVVVSINGEDFTAGQLDRLRNNLPEAFRERTQRMNTKSFVETFGYLHTLAGLAEEAGLDEKEPFKTQLEFNTMNFMAQAYLSEINGDLEITHEDQEEFYEEHKDDYTEARVSAIYFDYDPLPELAEKAGREVVSEQDAWGQAEQVLAELREGADFAAMAKEHSDDAGSAEKGGDLGWFKPEDQLSQALKKAIFSLEEGQISTPIKDGGRYYLLKVTETRPRPRKEIAPQMLQRLQSEMLRQRLDELRDSVEIEYKIPSYVE